MRTGDVCGHGGYWSSTLDTEVRPEHSRVQPGRRESLGLSYTTPEAKTGNFYRILVLQKSLATFLRAPSPIPASAGVYRHWKGQKTRRGLIIV